MIVLICNLDNMNTFYTSSNQSFLLITVYMVALIGDSVSARGYPIATAPMVPGLV